MIPCSISRTASYELYITELELLEILPVKVEASNVGTLFTNS